MELFDFLGYFFNFHGVLLGNEMMKFFWHFSVTYNIGFTKINCISIPH